MTNKDNFTDVVEQLPPKTPPVSENKPQIQAPQQVQSNDGQIITLGQSKKK